MAFGWVYIGFAVRNISSADEVIAREWNFIEQ